MFSAGENNRPEYYSIGVHPWYPNKNLMTKVREYATLPSVVAIGETGLDKIAADSPDKLKLQHELFTKHVLLSEEVRKPLIIHCVKAYDELLHAHKSTSPSVPWIIHGFRGKAALTNQLLNAGIYLSFGALHNIDSLKVAWEKRRLLIETDDTNTNIRDVYKKIANNLDITVKELSDEVAGIVLGAIHLNYMR